MMMIIVIVIAELTVVVCIVVVWLYGTLFMDLFVYLSERGDKLRKNILARNDLSYPESTLR